MQNEPQDELNLENYPYPHSGNTIASVDVSGEKKPSFSSRSNVFGDVPPKENKITHKNLDIKAKESEKDLDFIDIGSELPSRLCFYPYNSLGIKSFKTKHIIKIMEAMEMSSFEKIVDTVTAVLSDDVSARMLTIEDFFFVMYWLKLNSFKKSPMRVSFTCNNKDHLMRVFNKEVSEETLKNVTTLNSVGNLKVEYMTEEKLDKASEIITRMKENYGIDIFPPLVKDFISIQNFVSKRGDLETEIYKVQASNFEGASDLVENLKEELAALDAKYSTRQFASMIILEKDSTLEEKIEYLKNNEDLDAEFFFELEEFESTIRHGVIETATCSCKECNAKVEVPISIDALQFFPENVRKRFIAKAI